VRRHRYAVEAQQPKPKRKVSEMYKLVMFLVLVVTMLQRQLPPAKAGGLPNG